MVNKQITIVDGYSIENSKYHINGNIYDIDNNYSSTFISDFINKNMKNDLFYIYSHNNYTLVEINKAYYNKVNLDLSHIMSLIPLKDDYFIISLNKSKYLVDSLDDVIYLIDKYAYWLIRNGSFNEFLKENIKISM